MSKLYLFAPLLFFIFMVSGAFAYTEYNSNPYMAGINGFEIVDLTNYLTPSTTQSLGYDSIGSLLLTANSSPDFSPVAVQIYPLTENIFEYSNVPVYGSNEIFNVPANTELIASVMLRINGTANMEIDNAYRSIVFVDITNGAVSYVPIGTINDSQKTNISAILPAYKSPRTVSVHLSLGWINMSNTTTIEIGKFKVYSVDLRTNQNLWSGVASNDLATFCGSNAVLNTASPNYNFTTNRAFLVGLESDINNGTASICGAFKIGNLTIVSRFNALLNKSDTMPCTQYPITASSVLMNGANNLLFINDGTIGTALIEKLDTNTLTETFFQAPTGSGVMTLNFGSAYTSLKDLINNHTSAQRSDYALGLNATPTNNKFVITHTWGTCTHDGITADPRTASTLPLSVFFGGVSCPVQLVCFDNSQYVQNLDCSISNAQSCGGWGCGITGGCAIGFIGSQCLDNYTYTTTTQNGTVSAGSCYPKFCVNQTGNKITCSNTYVNASAKVTDQAGSWIENTLGLNSGLGKQTIAVVVSLIAPLGLIFAIVRWSGKKELDAKTLLLVFGVVFLVVLGLFTAWGWFSGWFYFAIVFLVALIVFFMLTRGV